jgi:hypothetical protein
MLMVEFLFKTREENVTFETCAILHLNHNQPWKIQMSLKSFEVFHGISCVMKRLPDKLATAIAINRENFSSPGVNFINNQCVTVRKAHKIL